MNLIINTYCNLHCPYCFADDAKGEYGKDIMSLENFKFCLDWCELNNDEIIQIIGGEPTINPDFSKYCDMVIEKGCFKELMIFTNGLFSEEVCEYLVSISKKIRVSFLFNVNDPKWLGAKRYEVLKRNLNRLFGKTQFSIGINLYSKDQDYKYIIDLAEEFGMEHVRFSLTIPNCEATITNFKEHYKNNKDNLIGLFKYAAEHHVKLYQDCNSIPVCFIEKDDLAEMLKWYPYLFDKLVCDKVVIDVAPDLKVYKCFAFTDPEHAPTLPEFKTRQDILHYFNQKYAKIQTQKLNNMCGECGTYLLNGQSCGCWRYRKTNNC